MHRALKLAPFLALTVSSILPAQTLPVRIMPLGDSITEARENYASYRYFLHHQLERAGYCFDLVGSKSGVQTGRAKFQNFDQDHEGHWGSTVDEMAARIYSLVQTTQPNIILSHLGSNDLSRGQSVASTIADYGVLIDEIRRAKPDATILVAQIVPFGPKFPFDVAPLNQALVGFVNNKTTATSPVILVDHFTGYSATEFHYDDVHPNAGGEERIARKWFEALAGHMTPCRPAHPGPVRMMAMGDSITLGRDGYATYRYFLDKELAASGHCVDFVGSRWGVRSGSAKYADFDQDHESYWGIRVDEMVPKAKDLVAKSMPDVVLVHLGTVDLTSGQTPESTRDDLGNLIDELRKGNPDVTIFLAQIIKVGPPFQVDVSQLNVLLPALVNAKADPRSKIVLVDHSDQWSPSFHSFDGVHPNEWGDSIIAKRWADAIKTLDLTCSAFFQTFGTGCVGSNGTPTLSGNAPILSGTFSMTFGSLPTNGSPAFVFFGSSATVWRGLQLPIRLDFFGMPNCWLQTGLSVTLPVANSGGTANLTINMPSSLEFSGDRFYTQAYVLDAGANALGATVTNAGVLRVGVRRSRREPSGRPSSTSERSVPAVA